MSTRSFILPSNLKRDDDLPLEVVEEIKAFLVSEGIDGILISTAVINKLYHDPLHVQLEDSSGVVDTTVVVTRVESTVGSFDDPVFNSPTMIISINKPEDKG